MRDASEACVALLPSCTPYIWPLFFFFFFFANDSDARARVCARWIAPDKPKSRFHYHKASLCDAVSVVYINAAAGN